MSACGEGRGGGGAYCQAFSRCWRKAVSRNWLAGGLRGEREEGSSSYFLVSGSSPSSVCRRHHGRLWNWASRRAECADQRHNGGRSRGMQRRGIRRLKLRMNSVLPSLFRSFVVGGGVELSRGSVLFGLIGLVGE